MHTKTVFALLAAATSGIAHAWSVSGYSGDSACGDSVNFEYRIVEGTDNHCHWFDASATTTCSHWYNGGTYSKKCPTNSNLVMASANVHKGHCYFYTDGNCDGLGWYEVSAGGYCQKAPFSQTFNSFYCD